MLIDNVKLSGDRPEYIRPTTTPYNSVEDVLGAKLVLITGWLVLFRQKVVLCRIHRTSGP